MDTLRDKIAGALTQTMMSSSKSGVVADAIMSIIENHIEWSDPDDCEFGHVYSDCGRYEITCGNFTLYEHERPSNRLSQHKTLDEAKRAAQAHKEGRG